MAEPSKVMVVSCVHGWEPVGGIAPCTGRAILHQRADAWAPESGVDLHRGTPREWAAVKDLLHLSGSVENGVGNGAHGAQRACSLKRVKSSFPAMRNRTVRMVLKRAYPRALRLA